MLKSCVISKLNEAHVLNMSNNKVGCFAVDKKELCVSLIVRKKQEMKRQLMEENRPCVCLWVCVCVLLLRMWVGLIDSEVEASLALQQPQHLCW